MSNTRRSGHYHGDVTKSAHNAKLHSQHSGKSQKTHTLTTAIHSRLFTKADRKLLETTSTCNMRLQSK